MLTRPPAGEGLAIWAHVSAELGRRALGARVRDLDDDAALVGFLLADARLGAVHLHPRQRGSCQVIAAHRQVFAQPAKATLLQIE